MRCLSSRRMALVLIFCSLGMMNTPLARIQQFQPLGGCQPTRTGASMASDVVETAINGGEFFVGESPFEDELVIGASRFHLIVGRLYSVEHGSIVFAHSDTFGARENDGAADFKLIGMLLDIVVCDRRILVGGDDAVIRQQLDHGSLILQGDDSDRRSVLLSAIIAGAL